MPSPPELGAVEISTEAFKDYYRSFRDPALRHGFRSLDDPLHLDHLVETAQSSLTRNFVLDFDDAAAYVAFDLPALSIATLLDAERPEPSYARWINICYPYHHRPLLELLAKRYDFSPRLLALMSSDPRLSRRSPPGSHHEAAPLKKFWSRHLRHPRSLRPRKGLMSCPSTLPSQAMTQL